MIRTIAFHCVPSALAVSTLLAATGTAGAELVYGVTQGQSLVTWQSGAPGTILSGVAIMGLQPNETVHGIDFRPATGELFALGSFNRFYTINPVSGQATQVGSPFALALNGSQFGFDFNPTVDRIRVVSDARQNLRLNPITGAVVDGDTVTPGLQPDGMLAYAAGDPGAASGTPDIIHAAYTNSFAGATTTTLYVIDAGRDVLCMQNANVGTLTSVGFLGTDITDFGGFDISGATGIAYLSIRDSQLGRSTFWTVNLSTGAASMVGEVGGGAIITAISVVPTPGTAAAGLLALAFGARRRR
ncbi:MAG: DUF4394 domain-containing protein [Phycisphaerales bacterium]